MHSAIGAVVFSVIGYFYIKNRGKGRFAKRFIPRLKSKDADFLKKAVEEEEREERALLSESELTDSKPPQNTTKDTGNT